MNKDLISNCVEELGQQGFVTLTGVVGSALLSSARTLCNRALGRASGLDTSAHLSEQLLGSELLEIADLITSRGVLEIATTLLGPNIRLSFAEYCRTLPEAKHSSLRQNDLSYDSKTSLGIHRDGALIESDMAAMSDSPRLSIKAAIWMSDVPNENMGNFAVIPGTHKLTQSDFDAGAWKGKPLKQITASPGDITFFDRRILHTRTPNYSEVTREVIFLEYCVRWIKRKMPVIAFPANNAPSTIAEQLLGEPIDPWELYWPSTDLPLNALVDEPPI